MSPMYELLYVSFTLKKMGTCNIPSALNNYTSIRNITQK